MSCERFKLAGEQDYISECQMQSENIEEVRFTVFGEPVPKARPRVTSGHTYTPVKTSNQEKKIALVYKSLYHGFRFDKGIPLKLEVDFYLGIPKSDSKKIREKKISGEMRPMVKRNDVDNMLKLVADGLNEVSYCDDSQIVEMAGRKFYSDKPRTEIKIIKIGGDNDGR